MIRRSVVDYALQRRAVLTDLFAGRAAVDDVCDAHPYLQRAAKYHGERTERSCPVCRRERLSNVRYVFGDQLKTTSGQAKTQREIKAMAARLGEFSVYVVEVCASCGWNHLITSYVTGAESPDQSGRKAATE